MLAKLSTARECLEQASGHTFRFFQQIQDPSMVHIIGKWDSIDAHGAFLVSPENQHLLQLLSEDVMSSKGKPEIQMWHLDVDAFDYPSLADSWLSSATCVAYQWCTVSMQGRAQHSEDFGDLVTAMKRSASAVGGWRIEKEAEDEEWMVFYDPKVKMGTSLPAEDHQEFGKTELATHLGELHMVALEGL